MADIFRDIAKFTARSFLNSIAAENLRDYAHASKIFIGNHFRLNPKNTFLFHVFFDIDPSLATGSVAETLALTELGLMVKNSDLPRYTVETKVYNSYNRPNVVQSKIRFDPITIVFHDDNANIVRNFWYDYYRYYFRDSDHSMSTYREDHKFEPQDSGNFGFTRRRESHTHYLRSIRIYSLHQKKFSEYILINPVIKSFRHGQHQNGPEGTMTHEMVIEYEHVLYSNGRTSEGNPSGFATLYYDKTPSPLRATGSSRSIFGPNGLLDSGSDILRDLENQNYLSAIFKTARTANTLRGMNIKKQVLGEITNAAGTMVSGAIQDIVSSAMRPTSNNGYNIPNLASSESFISNQYTGIPVRSSISDLAGVDLAPYSIGEGDYPVYDPVVQGNGNPPNNYNPQFPSDPGTPRPGIAEADFQIINDQDDLRPIGTGGIVNANNAKIDLNYNIDIKRSEIENLYMDLDNSQTQVTNTNSVLTDLNSRLSIAQSAPPSAQRESVIANLNEQINTTSQLNAAAQLSVARKLNEINVTKSELDGYNWQLNKLGS
jgi:hypothetical protein